MFCGDIVTMLQSPPSSIIDGPSHQVESHSGPNVGVNETASGYRSGSNCSDQSKMNPLSDAHKSHTSISHVPLRGQPLRLENG